MSMRLAPSWGSTSNMKDRWLSGSFTTVHRRICVVATRPGIRTENSLIIYHQLTNVCLYLVVEVVILTRLGHQWHHHGCCFVHMELLQGVFLWLEGFPPAA